MANYDDKKIMVMLVEWDKIPSPPMVAYRKAKSLKDSLVRARIPSLYFNNQGLYAVRVEWQRYNNPTYSHGKGQVSLYCGEGRTSKSWSLRLG